MSSGMVKTTIREIKASFGRYLAILAIVMLGVGLFAGLKITKPAMITTQNAYLREQNFFDFRLLSTIGFTDDDVEKLSHMEEVADIEGTISLDALCAIGGENEAVYKIHALPEKINKIELTAGRMPQAENECVLDAAKYSIEMLGSAFTVTDDNDEDTLDMFRNRTYTVVGIARSPYYMNFERGTTSIGEGRVEAFAYVPMEAFDSEYLTEVFVTLNEKYDVYTDEYEDYIDAVQDRVEQKTEEVVDERYQDLIDEAQEKIDDAQIELDDKSAEAEEELDKAWQEILDGEAEIEEHEQEISDGKEQIAQARDTINGQRAALDEQEEQLAAMEAMMTSGQYGAGAQAGGGQFEAGSAEMQAGSGQFAAGGADMQASGGQFAASGADMQANGGQFAESGAQMQAYGAQLAEGRAQIQAGREQLEEAEAELTSREAELAEGEEELLQAREDLEEGKAEYEDAKKEFEEEIADAQEKIDDARAELADIEQPDYYVLTRETNIGYACFDSDSSIVAAVANIFPVFFFLVAALICMTTMNRMVEEQRTQIGVLKALGYGNAAIMAKYMFYAGSAAIIGALTGLAGGTWLFPKTIWEGYKIMYDLGEITYLFNGWLAFFSVLAAVLCSVGAAFFSCRYELYSVPANLIRPKAPKNGKRIFLEKVTFIWKRLKFLHKVSVRNLVRYKKRFIMMILGISGCAALLVAGFGIRDSVANIADYQYGEIQIYDIGITYDGALTQAEMAAFTEQTADIFTKIAYRYEESADIDFGEKTKSLYMVIPENAEDMNKFIDLHTEQGAAIPYPAKGEAVITAKVAKNLGQLELEHENYACTICGDGRDALNIALGSDFDLIILDVMLPSLNGIEVLRRLRLSKQTPVIILTARDQVVDKVTGLDIGANDYMTKPFAIEELLARIRLHTKNAVHAVNNLVCGELSVNPDARAALYAGHPIDLTKKEFDLLLYLMQHRNVVISRETLLDEVWGFDFYGSTNVVDVYIRYLRAKIDNTFNVDIIETVRGAGYVIR